MKESARFARQSSQRVCEIYIHYYFIFHLVMDVKRRWDILYYCTNGGTLCRHMPVVLCMDQIDTHVYVIQFALFLGRGLFWSPVMTSLPVLCLCDEMTRCYVVGAVVCRLLNTRDVADGIAKNMKHGYKVRDAK